MLQRPDHGTGWGHFSDGQGCALMEGVHCLVNSGRLSRMCLTRAKAGGELSTWLSGLVTIYKAQAAINRGRGSKQGAGCLTQHKLPVVSMLRYGHSLLAVLVRGEAGTVEGRQWHASSLCPKDSPRGCKRWVFLLSAAHRLEKPRGLPWHILGRDNRVIRPQGRHSASKHGFCLPR